MSQAKKHGGPRSANVGSGKVKFHAGKSGNRAYTKSLVHKKAAKSASATRAAIRAIERKK